MIAVDQCFRTMPYTASNRRNRSLVTLPRWGGKVLLLEIILVHHRNILPTLHAFEQHVKRSVYQAGYVCQIAVPEFPSPDLWGWKKSDSISPWTTLWTVLPEASEACQELIKCGCKKAAINRCKCYKSSLGCTQLCFCSGQCSNSSDN